MPHSAASDLGLHCLPMSHKKDARLIWVKVNTVSSEYHNLHSDLITQMPRLICTFVVGSLSHEVAHFANVYAVP